MVSLTPKPAGLFRDLRPDENLHFVSINPSGQLPQSYISTTLTTEDYPELIGANAPVSTVAVGTVLAAYNWPAGTERYGNVARFVGAFFARLHEMQVPPHHPKWHQIDLAAGVPGWTRFPAAEEWIKKAGLNEGNSNRYAAIPQGSPGSLTVQQRDAIFAEFADYQTRRAALNPKQREALFSEFAEYQKQQSRSAASGQPVTPPLPQFATNQYHVLPQ
jgi:hypothetical protein